MAFLNLLKSNFRLLNLKPQQCTLEFHFVRKYSNFPYTKVYIQAEDENLVDLLKKSVPKLVYNSEIEKKKLLRSGHHQNSRTLNRLNRRQDELKSKLGSVSPVPLSLKYLSDVEEKESNNEETKPSNIDSEGEEKITNFPFTETSTPISGPYVNSKERELVIKDLADAADKEIRQRYELRKDVNNWMTAYDNYEDAYIQEEVTDDFELDEWKINYGTPDPASEISNVPCGGCGALLHCKDTSIPGYIPSEIYKNSMAKGGANLAAITCQRCHFLKNYNLALQMRVSPDDYPKVLATVGEKRGLVVLMVDLLDFPCSIWPGIADIFGRGMSMVIVGNKVDLLPKDSKGYLDNIKRTLLENVRLSGFATLNIKHVALISAKTGYGVEELITRLGSFYRYKGDIYIVGCTNVGKSSLFNALLQSDFCKVQAIDLIQRATTSVWPGTTLNLLKFPVKRPSGFRQFLRHKRLEEAKKIASAENELRQSQLKKTKDLKYATLIGNIDVTRTPTDKFDETKDYFSVQGTSNASGKVKMGLNEKAIEFAYSKWCFDTPGVVQPDQLIHLLTTEELVLTLPKELIIPRTFCLKPGMSLFIAGLSRLDFTEGTSSVKLTVFCSNELPVTVCFNEDADEVYETLLGSKLFKVPAGSRKRLEQWRKLELAKTFTIKGELWNKSVKDVVLSSSGFVAITGQTDGDYCFQAWTPERRGVYIRDPLLPYAVNLKGKRMPYSVAYGRHRFYTK